MNFSRIAQHIDIEPIVTTLIKHPELWNGITERQTYKGSAHHDTQAIIVRGPKPTRNVWSEIDCIDYPYAAPLARHVEILVRRIRMHIGRTGLLGRVMVVNLKQDGHIDAHVDEGRYADHFQRFHLALLALPGVHFNVGEQRFEAVSGELWWFNHKRTHSLVNLSGADRWHLIVDVEAPHYAERMWSK